ncbi:MAG TPA: LytTR family DNA-binding domain-containing protein [Flavobacterium sp.]|jgi:DNA-binding LytR/AlgR family response regulator
MVKVNIKDILYMEAEQDYCRIYCKGKGLLLVMTLKELAQKLPPKRFVRIHRSFIVNVKKIDEVALNHVVVAKKSIPVSKNLREELLNRLRTV